VATADAVGAIWRDLRRCQVFPVNPLTGLLGFVGARDRLGPESGLRRLITRHLQEDEFDDLLVPLIDGGVANNTPISHAAELGARRIYVVPTGHACALQEPPGGALAWRCMPSACSPTGG
jgi:NTE family protein